MIARGFKYKMNTNYILVDYENVQPKSLELLSGKAFRVLIFLGENQTKIPVELARSLQWLGKDAEYIQISGNGTNALDFHIAYRLGELSHLDPQATFHVISKDKGYDPLITHIKRKGIKITRSKSIQEIPALQEHTPKSVPKRISKIVASLIAKGNGRPRKLKTLKNFIKSHSKEMSEGELEKAAKDLAKLGYISIENGNVSYHLEKPSKS